MFKFEIISWINFSTDSQNSIIEFQRGLFKNNKYFYGYLTNALKSTDDTKSGNQIKTWSDEINN